MPLVLNSDDPRIPVGSKLLKIDEHIIDDVFDYQFYDDGSRPRRFLISFNKRQKMIRFNPGEHANLVLEEPVYKKCENDCSYCFIKGLPKGLRRELYFRDDDYRLSFLFGNFLSLTNLTDYDIKRIKKFKLSPIYVSVHSTNPDLRAQLFKNKRARLIMEQLKALCEGNIKVHCQIVVIPGITDGNNILQTVNDLVALYPEVNTVGIVPVGRTKFLTRIPAIDKKSALKIVKQAMLLHKNFKKRIKKGFVYLADEFFIKSGTDIPEKDYYDDFCQYENGIGMVRQLLDEIDALRFRNKISGKFLFITGEHAYPYIHYLKEKLSSKVLTIDVVPVKNRFFGNSITVSGLLTGSDINATIKRLNKKYDRIILPPNCVNDDGRFLDEDRFEKIEYLVSPYSIKELILCLQ
ncbi:MAG: DUF512 domain-containing protein [bacterium]